MTVRDNIAFGLKIRKRPKDEIRERVDELLALVHLGGWADRYPAQLSGGQRQRMALARALAVQPRVLLLDEPFGALDATVRKELRDWLRKLHDEVHVTTIFVTHDQEEALEVAQQVAVINGGRIEQTGTPDDLYERPANPFVMGFVGPVSPARRTRGCARTTSRCSRIDEDGALEAHRRARRARRLRGPHRGGARRRQLGRRCSRPASRPTSSSCARARSCGCGSTARASSRHDGRVRVSAKVDYAVRAGVELAAAQERAGRRRGR